MTLHVTFTPSVLPFPLAMEETATGPRVMHASFQGAWKREESAESADLFQVDYLESDAFFKLVGYILLAPTATSENQSQ